VRGLSFGVNSIMKKYFYFLAFLFSSIALAEPTTKENLFALIQTHQPYINKATIENTYDQAFIKQRYPKTVFKDGFARLDQKGQQTTWQFDESGRIKKVQFKFNLKKWKSTKAEKLILEKYRKEITADRLAQVDSASRTLRIVDESQNVELGILIPLSDYSSFSIKSIALFRGEKSKK